MKRIFIFLFKFSIILVSVSFVDGGRTLFSAGSNIHSIFINKHSNDLESTDFNNLDILPDNENWIESDDNIIAFSPATSDLIIYDTGQKAQDFTRLIWQPPQSF